MNTGNFIAFKKQRTFTELLQMMMKQDLILQIINQTVHYLKKKLSFIRLMIVGLNGKIRTVFVALGPKKYIYLTDVNVENKKTKSKKKCAFKRKLKFDDYKLFFKQLNLENILQYLEKNKLDRNSPQYNHKGFIKTIN